MTWTVWTRPLFPPARLALVTIQQVYTRASEDEAIEVLAMDQRWQLVADCMDAERALYS